MRNLASSCVLGVMLLACSSSTSGSGGGSNRVGVDSASLCDKLINECKQSITPASCDVVLSVVRVTPECATKLGSAACDVLNASFAGNDDECFPSCTNPGGQTCNGDGTITTCSTSSRSFVLDCEATCQKVSNPPKTFSGTCGTSFGAQQSEDGKEKCWCQ